jgi:membrane protease YdiL (CAAX protease family)
MRSFWRHRWGCSLEEPGSDQRNSVGWRGIMFTMDTPLGYALQKTPAKTWFAVGIALAAIGTDFFLKSFRLRSLVIGVSLLIFVLLAQGDRASLGLVVRLRPSYRYWVKVTLGIGAAVAGFCIVAVFLLWIIGIHMPISARPPERILSALVSYCISAPVLEEALYRLVLCVALVRIAGPWWTIFASGAIFAALHFVWGNASPDNFIAGYFLAWAFLKSGSILTPIVLHSLGNLCVLALHVANWYRIS